MQKEQLLNLLDEDARQALDHAKQLALWRGGVLSPLHLTIALLERLLGDATITHGEKTRLLLKAHDVLAARFPLPADSITVTRETQVLIAEAAELARLSNNVNNAPNAAPNVTPIHLLRSAFANATVEQLLGDLTEYKELIADLDSGFETSGPAETSGTTTEMSETTRRRDSGALSADAGLSGALAEFCADLAVESRSESAHQFFGREREMMAVLETLCRKLKNNALLIGKPGVGKTALVTAVAARLCEGQVPARLRGKRILEVSRLRLLADAKFSGDIEERLKQLLEEVKRAGNVILFFDEIHTLLGAGGAGGTGDIANLLKSALSKGEVTCIGATTLAEYYKYIARDEALARRFSTIKIDEPSCEETRQILTHARPSFESYHGVTIGEEAIELIIELADRYLHSRSFPDKAFDLLDKAAAKSTMASVESLTRECVIEALSEITGLPLEIMHEDPAERLERLEEFLNHAVPGQSRAARDIARVVRIAKLHLELRPERPDGIFLFVGVEGAGKHEMAAALAKFLYGSAQKMTDFDMSQFTESWALSRLVGAEPGYVGYAERSGLLSKAAEDNPHSLLYFRNIDLAHPVIQQFLGETFDQGRFADATGARISLSNMSIIMSLSPISENPKHSPVGFFTGGEETEARPLTGNLKLSGSLKLRERGSGYNLVESLSAAIDEVVEFQVLDRVATEQIIAERLASLRARLEAAQPVRIRMDESLTKFFADRLAEERKSPAQLERLWKESIVIPFTNLLPKKRNGNERVEIQIRVEGNDVKVVIEAAPAS